MLDLSGNALSALPEDLARLHRLRVLFCSNNRFTELPAVAGPVRAASTWSASRPTASGRCRPTSLPPALRWLILTDNEIDALPSAIGRCTRLQKLMLAGNRLQALPAELAACRALELLRISANRLEALPDWLPALPRLAWLAFAGNPFDDRAESGRGGRGGHCRASTGGACRCSDKLGEGASGVIHRADWRAARRQRPAGGREAVQGRGDQRRLAAQRDGRLHRRRRASEPDRGRGPHPGPSRRHVRPGAGPGGPALSQPGRAAQPGLLHPRCLCRRRRAGRWRAARRLACGIASAAAQLHARGILHGDLYAHNILWDGEGDGLLGDFGAASFLPPDEPDQALALQRIEARAFGLLLEELRSRCQPADESESATLARWADLQARCTQPDAGARPLLAEIAAALAAA